MIRYDNNRSFLKILQAVASLDWRIAILREGPTLNGVVVGIAAYVELMAELFPAMIQLIDLPPHMTNNILPDSDENEDDFEVPDESVLLVSAAGELGWDIAVANPDEDDDVYGMLLGHGQALETILEALPEDFLDQLESRSRSHLE